MADDDDDDDDDNDKDDNVGSMIDSSLLTFVSLQFIIYSARGHACKHIKFISSIMVVFRVPCCQCFRYVYGKFGGSRESHCVVPVFFDHLNFVHLISYDNNNNPTGGW